MKAKTASHFASCYAEAMAQLGEQAELLQGGDLVSVEDNVRNAKDRLKQEAQSAPQIGTKRLKGKQLLDATEKKEKMEAPEPKQEPAEEKGLFMGRGPSVWKTILHYWISCLFNPCGS